MTALSVREATVADLETITEFNLRLAQETEGLALDRETVARGVRAVLVGNARGRYHVAYTDRIVGQLMQTSEWSDWRNGEIWWIQSVYVSARSRRRGVFRALYAHLRHLAVRNPAVVGLRLYVERQNDIARATYQELGMTTCRYVVMEELL